MSTDGAHPRGARTEAPQPRLPRRLRDRRRRSRGDRARRRRRRRRSGTPGDGRTGRSRRRGRGIRIPPHRDHVAVPRGRRGRAGHGHARHAVLGRHVGTERGRAFHAAPVRRHRVHGDLLRRAGPRRRTGGDVHRDVPHARGRGVPAAAHHERRHDLPHRPGRRGGRAGLQRRSHRGLPRDGEPPGRLRALRRRSGAHRHRPGRRIAAHAAAAGRRVRHESAERRSRRADRVHLLGCRSRRVGRPRERPVHGVAQGERRGCRAHARRGDGGRAARRRVAVRARHRQHPAAVVRRHAAADGFVGRAGDRARLGTVDRGHRARARPRRSSSAARARS